MKKFLTILLVVLMALPCTAYADETYPTSISLCYSGDAYAVDYVFNVPEGTNISSVTISDANCFYDWNYDKNEARLYISLASGNVIVKTKSIVTIVTDNEKIFLEPVSIVVNGNIKENVSAYHTAIPMDALAPGFDTPGHIGGEKCANCGITLIEPTPVSPTGPKVKAVLDEIGTLTVSGGLSDNPTAEGTTFLAVYNKDNRMLTLANITDQDQSDFSISIENMKDAHTVKVLRWETATLRPLHNAVEVNVISK